MYTVFIRAKSTLSLGGEYATITKVKNLEDISVENGVIMDVRVLEKTEEESHLMMTQEQRLRHIVDTISEQRSDAFGDRYGLSDITEGKPELEAKADRLAEETNLYDQLLVLIKGSVIYGSSVKYEQNKKLDLLNPNPTCVECGDELDDYSSPYCIDCVKF